MPALDRGASRLATRLLDDADARAAFCDALARGDAARPAVLWRDPRPEPAPWVPRPPTAWQPDFVDVPPADARPGRDPLHDAGALYCLDLSSVFAARPLTDLPPRPELVVDVCAAPGGKSVFAWRALSPGLLVANETIGKRLGPLSGNLTRCRVAPAVLASLDPSRLAPCAEAAADVVLVDAPCSGQSLLARGVANPGCFHEVTVSQNAGRQRRIVAESARMVAPGGWLLYTTCTFSKEENEDVVRWLRRQRPDLEPQTVPALDCHRSPHADFPCYRLWPHEDAGAGAFACLLRRADDGPRGVLYRDALSASS